MTLPDRQTTEHDDPFYWGSRYVYVEKNGRRQLTEIPLTRADILDPQEGDILMHGPTHGYVIRELATRLDRWFQSQGRTMAVYDSVKILWGVPDISEVAPDISIIPGVEDPWRLDREHNSYSVVEEGQLPCLVIEVISPRYKDIDTKDKVQVYRRAKVEEYLILDILEVPVELTGYRLGKDGLYHRSRSRSRWRSETTGLWFRAGSEPLEILVEDVATGERLLGAKEEALLRQAAEQRAEDLERRAKAETEARRALEQELERLRREHNLR